MAGSHSITNYSRGLPTQTRLDRLDNMIIEAFKVLVIWQKRSRERHHLARLTPRMLRDIGLTGEQAQVESRKPFWIA